MSRKLDALFAERVLGWTHHPGGCAESDPDCMLDSFGDHRYAGYYTTSLDAAWEGVEKLGWQYVDLDCLSASGTWMVNNEYNQAKDPAEALVLACLRAVGVTKAEIEAAQAGE